MTTLPDPERWHEFEEDAEDASMCLCGIPALYHDTAMAALWNPDAEGDL